MTVFLRCREACTIHQPLSGTFWNTYPEECSHEAGARQSETAVPRWWRYYITKSRAGHYTVTVVDKTYGVKVSRGLIENHEQALSALPQLRTNLQAAVYRRLQMRG